MSFMLYFHTLAALTLYTSVIALSCSFASSLSLSACLNLEAPTDECNDSVDADRLTRFVSLFVKPTKFLYIPLEPRAMS